jgi:hypothetical protein
MDASMLLRLLYQNINIQILLKGNCTRKSEDEEREGIGERELL